MNRGFKVVMAFTIAAMVGGFMGCWNFGNMPSANTAAFNRFFLGRFRSREGGGTFLKFSAISILLLAVQLKKNPWELMRNQGVKRSYLFYSI